MGICGHLGDCYGACKQGTPCHVSGGTSWRCIKMHSDRGGVVLEPFAGCGTTLIACEQTERHCYAMEISPIYCDLIIKRWESFTGETAVKLEV